VLTPTTATGPVVRRGQVQLLMAASATSSFDRFVTGPLLLTLAAELSVSLTSAAAAASWYYLLYGIGQPVWGLASDRFGRVRTMRAALMVAALAGAFGVLAPTFGTLVVARAVAGAAMGAVVPTCLVYVGDAVPIARRQHTLTDLNAATATGITAATALGGVLAATVSWRAAFAVPAVGAALLAVLLRRLPEPARSSVAQTGVVTVLRHRWGRRVLALSLAEGAVLLGLLTYLAPALESTGQSSTTAGLVVALYGVGLLLASRVVKRRVLRTDPRVLLGVGAALLVVAYSVTVVSRSAVAVGITALLVGFGWAPLHSTMQTWATEVVPEARAAMVSLFAAMLFLGSGVATAVLAPLAGDHRWTPMFGAAAVLTALFGVVVVAVRGRYPRTAVLPTS
jgi:predicted MFS family arabinose efflux permease